MIEFKFPQIIDLKITDKNEIIILNIEDMKNKIINILYQQEKKENPIKYM